MKIKHYIIFLLLLSSLCHSQRKGKTVVFKLKAPLAKAEIVSKEEVLYLEKESTIDVNVKGRNAKIKVTIEGGEILSQENNTYRFRLLEIGTAVIKVFQILPKGTRMIAIKKWEVKPPTTVFCGLKMDSTSYQLRIGKCHLYAYSEYFKQKMPINKFTMLYYEPEDGRRRKKAITDTLKSDTCLLTKAMRDRLNNFQPSKSSIYLFNMLCSVPGGSYRVLEPVELRIVQDTTVNSHRALYWLKKKKFD